MYIHIVICIKILTNADCSKLFPKQIVYKTNTMLIIIHQRITLQYLPRRNARENSFRSKGKITVTRWFLRFQPFFIALELGCYYRGRKVIRITCTISRASP